VMRPGRRPRRGPHPGSGRRRSPSQSGLRPAGQGHSGGSRSVGKPAAYGDADLLFIQRAAVSEPVAVEVDRPLAFRPRLMGFWRGTEFYQVVRVVATRLEYGVTYHRVLTDRGAFDLRHVRRMDPMTLRARRVWEVCAELDTVPVARLP
jgi:hypothetical protein